MRKCRKTWCITKKHEGIPKNLRGQTKKRWVEIKKVEWLQKYEAISKNVTDYKKTRGDTKKMRLINFGSYYEIC